MKSCRKCQPTPTEPGYYWATYHVRIKSKAGVLLEKRDDRMIVQVGKNGFGQMRVFVPRWSGSAGLEEFSDWVGPLKEKA